ncbi:MAG: hypothetical protein H7125_04450 [Proteobacteria bacterium]|nr:hypothetical protein [Burkholderiales bacterium]
MAQEAVSDDIRKLAASLGLARLSEVHLQQLMKAARAAQARRSILQSASLVASDEPAHVYRLP